MAKPDGIDGLALVLELERQVLFADQPLRHDLDFFAEGGRGKALAPDFPVQGINQVGAPVFGRQRAVGVEPARQRGGVQPFAGDLLQRVS
jgi:hypothetical protein